MASTSSTPSRRQVRRRTIGLLILFLVSAGLAFNGPLNWFASKAQGILGITFGNVEQPFVLGLDLQGGTRLEYEADVAKVAPTDRKEALSGVRDVIERRVNTLGVSEPSIQTVQAGDSWRVNVELAGIRDVSEAIKLIGETPILEFKEENPNPTSQLTVEQQKEMETKNAESKKKADAVLEEARKKETDFSKLSDQKDLGFLIGKSEHNDLYPKLKDQKVGTTYPFLIERPSSYAIARVEEEKQEKEVQAHHLLISYQGAQSDLSTFTKEQARSKIEELKKQATPANFKDLVVNNSHEPGVIETKGDLGWFGRGAMVEEFEKAVFDQKVGTISDIVESPFGYHLIWKNGERPVRDIRVRTVEFPRLTPEQIAPPDPWKATKLTGRDLSSARLDFDQQTGVIQVAIQFNSEGAKLFEEITNRNLNKQIAIFLDGQIISAPTVQTAIVGGQAVISGNFSVDEAKILARRLQAGALPVPIKLIAQQTVGPTLGADSLQKSLQAGLVGFLLVALYMIFLYRLPGVVSIVALLLYAAVSLALFKLIPVTLSLAGIAGFILSLGIAVDANVLVFERLKEEWKEGKGFAQAIEDAFRRAWPSIRDGHATVLISCAVLYWFSSSVIKGFALTLAIGTLLSLFTAVVSCRTFLRLFVNTRLAQFGWAFLKKS